MYGTLCRMYPKPGQQQAVLDHLFRWEQEHLPTARGYVGGYLLEPAAQALLQPFGLLFIVIFDSQASYSRQRDDPQQGRWEQRLEDLLEHAPQWHEGEITQLLAQPHGL